MTIQSELIPTMPGDILRYEREKQGLSVERAGELSKIKPAVLIAIEDGTTDSIPAVYLRGYIRNYARFLGVDPERLDDHMEHVRSSVPEVRSVFEVQQKIPGTERWLKASSYLAASALIATLAWQFTHEAVRFSQGETRIPQGAAAEPVVEETASAAENSSAPPANRHLNASIASIEVLNQGSEQPDGPEEANAWTDLETVAQPVDELPDGQQSLRVSTSADTWVEVLDGAGAQLEMDLIRADESRLYKGNPPFRILVGRASSVRLQLDGEEVNLAPHTRGNVARLTLGNPPGSQVSTEPEDFDR